MNAIDPVPVGRRLTESNDQRWWCKVLGAGSYFMIGGLDEDCINIL